MRFSPPRPASGTVERHGLSFGVSKQRLIGGISGCVCVYITHRKYLWMCMRLCHSHISHIPKPSLMSLVGIIPSEIKRKKKNGNERIINRQDVVN